MIPFPTYEELTQDQILLRNWRIMNQQWRNSRSPIARHYARQFAQELWHRRNLEQKP